MKYLMSVPCIVSIFFFIKMIYFYFLRHSITWYQVSPMTFPSVKSEKLLRKPVYYECSLLFYWFHLAQAHADSRLAFSLQQPKESYFLPLPILSPPLYEIACSRDASNAEETSTIVQVFHLVFVCYNDCYPPLESAILQLAIHSKETTKQNANKYIPAPNILTAAVLITLGLIRTHISSFSTTISHLISSC